MPARRSNETHRRSAALGAAALLLLFAGCAVTPEGSASSPAAPAESPTAALSGSITVAAAASLSEVFPALAEEFAAHHPVATVQFSFGGSSTLAAQIVSGAPADVFASASASTMQTVQDADLTAAEPVVVARNQLEIAVPPGNPGGVTGLADFADEAKTVVVCDEEVPCGAAAQKVFEASGIDARPDSLEPDVTAVLTKVRTGEADAGLVYVTDVIAAGDDVEGIPFPESDHAITDYPIAALTGSANPELAQAWVDFVVDQGGGALQAAGFLAPR